MSTGDHSHDLVQKLCQLKDESLRSKYVQTSFILKKISAVFKNKERFEEICKLLPQI